MLLIRDIFKLDNYQTRCKQGMYCSTFDRTVIVVAKHNHVWSTFYIFEYRLLINNYIVLQATNQIQETMYDR